jgi:hypothetical protein
MENQDIQAQTQTQTQTQTHIQAQTQIQAQTNELIQTIESESVRNPELSASMDSVAAAVDVSVPETIQDSMFNTESDPESETKSEPEIITQARKKLENWIGGVLSNKIPMGFRRVYNSTEIFEILNEHPEYNKIRKVAFGRSGFLYDIYCALFQFRFNDRLINIVTCSEDHDNTIIPRYMYGLEETNTISLSYPMKQVRDVMRRDLITKLNKMSFFLDYNEACKFIINKAKRLYMRIIFVENQKFSKIKKEIREKKAIARNIKKQTEIENRRLEYERQRELKIYGPSGKPKPLTFGDFFSGI